MQRIAGDGVGEEVHVWGKTGGSEGAGDGEVRRESGGFGTRGGVDWGGDEARDWGGEEALVG
jgi:hypothetical protein